MSRLFKYSRKSMKPVSCGLSRFRLWAKTPVDKYVRQISKTQKTTEGKFFNKQRQNVLCARLRRRKELVSTCCLPQETLIRGWPLKNILSLLPKTQIQSPAAKLTIRRLAPRWRRASTLYCA